VAANIHDVTLPAVADGDHIVVVTCQFDANVITEDAANIVRVGYQGYAGGTTYGDSIHPRLGRHTYTLTGEFAVIQHASGGGQAFLHEETPFGPGTSDVDYYDMHIQAVLVRR